ncbi:MAG TPA: class I SAM-dependent methyltransferase [Thermoanaerobaculia bacterium]|nr:class I SAM-dependent methyltransferase [Thermoanaerobaculia bacterium]
MVHDGMTLPARHLRYCGPTLKDEESFLRSAVTEARRLQERCGLGVSTRLLDVGCGYGRLALGLLARSTVPAAYRGIDVDRHAITWCSRHVAPLEDNFTFLHLDLENSRYNPGGKRLGDGLRLPFPDRSFDIIYLFSVFSHMTPDHVAVYLRELARLLEDGRVFLTAFIEQGVEPVAINPLAYRRPWSGPLHCVRYERSFFDGMVRGAGLVVERFDAGTEIDGQSGVYLARP